METVYELIQHLSKYPADAKLQIIMYTPNEHLEHYLDDSKHSGMLGANIYAEAVRVKQLYDSNIVNIECQSYDL